jgi:hypothetical protein
VSLLPRLRQACVEAKASSGASPIVPRLGDLDELEEGVNRAVLSGVMVEEPQRDKSRDGDPITVLLIAFAAPDERARSGSACCEVEVLDEIADRYRRQLRLGSTVLVVGELIGAGGLWANFLAVKTPRRSAE